MFNINKRKGYDTYSVSVVNATRKSPTAASLERKIIFRFN